MRCYPLRLRFVVVILTALIAVGMVLGWVSLPSRVQAQFTLPQLATLIGVIVAVVVVIGLVAGSYVRADDTGLVFRNGLRTYRYDWLSVVRVTYRNGDPWASVWVSESTTEEAAEPTRMMLLGIQRSDRSRAQQAVSQLRRLHATRCHEP